VGGREGGRGEGVDEGPALSLGWVGEIRGEERSRERGRERDGEGRVVVVCGRNRRKLRFKRGADGRRFCFRSGGGRSFSHFFTPCFSLAFSLLKGEESLD